MPADTNNAPAIASPQPRPGKKYFSVSEANRALPYIRRVTNDMRQPYAKVVELERRLEHLEDNETRDLIEADIERQRETLSTLVEELQQVGVELKDPDKLLLDFPAIHEGREIYLCWHNGEPNVTHWHEVGAGFAGRQDVQTLSSSEK